MLTLADVVARKREFATWGQAGTAPNPRTQPQRGQARSEECASGCTGDLSESGAAGKAEELSLIDLTLGDGLGEVEPNWPEG